MGRVLAIAAALFLAYWLVGVIMDRGAGPRVDGETVQVETEDLEFRFARSIPVQDAYMIFGGNNAQMRNSTTHATVAALRIDDARLIAERYPDFHMCKSQGAATAQRLIETVGFVGAGSAVRSTVRKVVDLHDERIQSGGERTCIQVSGARLSLDSVKVKENGEDITAQVRGPLAGTTLVLAEKAEIADCEALLRR